MKIMVTGDQGYIGSVLVPTLLEKGYDVVGFDSGFFSENLLTDYHDSYPKITKDLRDLTIEDLEGVEGVIHLAGLSNDPLGEFSPKLTQDINYSGTIRFAKMSQEAGVKRFVYAS